MKNHCWGVVLAASLALTASSTVLAGPESVSGPGHDPECFAPWNDDIGYFQWEKRDGPTSLPWSTALSATLGESR